MDPKEAEILGSLRDPSARRAGGDKTAEAVAARQVQAQRGVLTFADTLEQVTLEDVAVHFSADEWSLLEGWQKALHQEVMRENYTLLLSLGHSVPSEDLPSILRPPEGTFESQALGSSRGGGSDAEGEEAPLPEDAVAAEGPWDLDCVSDGEEGRLTPGSGDEGDCQSSLHLCALMKLVKEIPEFLYGHGKASGGDSGAPSGGSEAGTAAEASHQVKAEARMENLHHASLDTYLAEVSLSLPSRPDTPTSSTEGDWGEPRASSLHTQDEAKSLLTSYEGSTNKAGGEDGAESRPSSTAQAPARDLPCDGTAGDAAELRRRAKSRAGRNLPKGTTDHLRGPEPDACGCHHRGSPSASGPGRLAAAPPSPTPSTAPSPLETTSADPNQQSSRKEGGGWAGALGGLSLRSSCATGERLLPETVGPGGGSTQGLPNPAAQEERSYKAFEMATTVSFSPEEATAEERPLQGLLLARSLRELLLHQPPPSHQAPWQHVPWRRRREVGSGPPPVPVKTEAAAAAEEEEPLLLFHSQGDSGRDGSESSAVPGGSSPRSTVWPAGGGRGSPPERPASSPFAAVQHKVLTDGSPLPCLERTANSVSPPGGAAARGRTAPETGGLPVRIKTEPTAEEEPALQGLQQELPAGCRLQPSLPNHSASHYGTKAGMDLGLWEPYSEEWSPVTSPLHGLLNCLKEIPTPRPPAGKRGGGERRKGGRRGRPDALLETVLPPAACRLGERPVKQPQRAPVALPSSRASSNLPYDAEWRKPEAGVAPLSRKEDALGLRHGSSSSSAPWQGLERCLEEPPLHAHSQPPSPAISSSFSSSPDELRRWTPEMGKWSRTEAGGLSRNSSPGQGLGRCVKELLLLPPNAPSQPCSPAISSSPDGLQGWRMLETGKWTREQEEEENGARQPPRVPPLQGLENCLKDIPTSGTSLPGGSVAASSRCSGQKRRRAEDTWQRLWPGERVLQSPASISGSVETDTSVERSPLHRLMRCLQGFPIQRPSYLRTPSVSSSSSSCSEAERDQQSPGSGAWWDCSQGTCPRGSELDVAVGQKGVESSRRRSPVSALPSDKERVPSTPQGEVDHGAAAGTSPLRGLENCLKDIAGIQLPCASSPLASANLHRDAAPGRPEAGALGARPAGSLPTSGLQSCLKDPAAGALHRSQTPLVLAPPGRKAERDVERSRLEAQVPRQPPEALGEAAAHSLCLQGVARDLAEWPAKPSPSSSQDNSEPREWDAAHRSTPSGEEEGPTDSSPLQGLLRCLQEITVGGPSPHSSSASDTREEARPKRGEEETEPGGRTSQEGLGSCLKERPGSRASPATTPLSSPVREKVMRSPHPAVGGGHRAGGVVPTSSAACGVGTSTKAAPGSGNLCALSRRAPPHKLGAPRWSDSGSPSRSGSKRSLVTARGRDFQGASCSFKSLGNGSSPKAEPENPSKKRCPALALPVPSSCSWGPGKPPEGLAGVGSLAPVLSKKLDRLSTDMSGICRDVSRLQSHMDRLEEDARSWVLELATLRMENRCLSEHVRRMESRCRTLENRSRRNNLRLLGLPEGVEGRDAVSFLQKTLPAMLGLPPDAPTLALESARRVQAGLSWDPNGRPRPLVFRLLRFADKAAILQAARRQPLSYAGTQVTISPDFCSSSLLQRRRRMPFGAGRRSRWAADLCLGSPRHACCWAWTREPREPLASAGPLAGEREGRGPKGPGTDQWGPGALEGPGRPGGCPAAGSLEQHSPTHK